MKFPHRKIEGAFMLLLAALCFWFPYHLKQPGLAHQRLLVATEKMTGAYFPHTVILILHHDGFNALGFVLNKPGAAPGGPAEGGPVAPERYYTVHSTDVTTPETLTVPELDIGYTEGEIFAKSGAGGKKPREYIVFRGNSGWGLQQLAREISDGRWKVIAFDRNLVFHTDPAKMWNIAVKRPAIAD